MTDFLAHLLVWTGLLIALVLVLRRPVARHFGPQAAYALWLLPLLRLLLPPIELPAWLAPTPAVAAAEADAATYAFVITGDAVALPPPVTVGDGTNWAAVLLAIWLGGAAVFLVRRFTLYFRMRDELLADATPVGSSGGVRLVETPAATSPVAFGVVDRVIALPPGFMAWHDRTARDLALAHELAHHRGRDLLANFAAQPLFALHWFNPLGWYGWSAMRRDQEAACDARVVAACARELRGTYASVIASFAAGPNVALAAPMACPVLGQKSVIHRLRSLTMSDISPRRRMAGRLLLALGVVALPATASITYAKATAAQDVPASPLPPEPPSAIDAPQAPTPPAAPEIVEEIELAPGADGEVRKVVIVRREADPNKPRDTEHRDIERRVHVIRTDGQAMSDDERVELENGLREAMKDMDVRMEEARKAQRLAMVEARRAHGLKRVEVRCDDGKEGAAISTHDGKQVVTLCKSQIWAQAVSGLSSARAQIAANKDMDEAVRQQILSSLDAEIARMAAEKD